MAAKFIFLRPLKLTIRASAPFAATSSRKNYLRPKILKTLTNSSTASTSSTNSTSTQPTLLPQPPQESLIDQPQDTVHSLEDSFTAEVKSDVLLPPTNQPGNKFPINSALKFVLYFVGVLFFQTISAVLILGVSHTVKEEQNSYARLPSNNEVDQIDEEEIEKKVKEIQKLARLARQREQLEKQMQSPNATRGNIVTEAAAEGKKKEEGSENGSHFTNPYILAIFIPSIKGYYCLNVSSKAYTIAFEDYTDANNFCFVLQSHFEEKENNFSVDIVQISSKELHEEDKSKILVVKKGKLKLYAGQPLEELENAMQTLFSKAK